MNAAGNEAISEGSVDLDDWIEVSGLFPLLERELRVRVGGVWPGCLCWGAMFSCEGLG